MTVTWPILREFFGYFYGIAILGIKEVRNGLSPILCVPGPEEKGGWVRDDRGYEIYSRVYSNLRFLHPGKSNSKHSVNKGK